jgi:hypothetical protein
MIIRRVTLVVAGRSSYTMPRSATPWLPRALSEGPAERDRAAAGMPDRVKVHTGLQQPATGSHLPLEDTALPFAVSPDFTQPRWDGALRGLPCQAPSEGECPRAWPEGPCEARDRAAAGISRPREEPVGAFASRYGVASSFGRHCFALRGRTIRVVAFRASHPAKPPSRQRRFVQRFP